MFTGYCSLHMSWTNYHSHCSFCDGTDQPEAYVQCALEKELLAYGFSSHAPVPFDCNWCLHISNAEAYRSQIRQLQRDYADQLQIYCGLEVDYIPGVIGPDHPTIGRLELDYTIGSVHFVDAFANDQPWEIDGSHGLFMRGLHEIFGDDIRRAVSRYFALTRQMVREECPDVVGHLDKIKIQNEAGGLFSEGEEWYRSEVEQTLRVIADAGVPVEVNTRGIYKKKTTETYPSRGVLERMRQLNIPIMLNSDAHHPDEIIRGFPEAARQLLAVGYREVWVLLDGQWQFIPFDENGLVVTF